MIGAQQLDALEPQMRQAMLSLLAGIRAKDELIAQRDREAAFKHALIDKLTHEMAVLKRLKFAAIHVLIGGISQRHNFAHRLAKLTGFVEFGNAAGRFLNALDGREVGCGRRELAVEALGDEAGRAAAVRPAGRVRRR